MTEKQFLDDLEKKLWTSANKLLPSLDAALYKHVILGMVFLKYVSDSFKTRQDELKIAFNDYENEYYLGDDAEPTFIEDDFYTASIYSPPRPNRRKQDRPFPKIRERRKDGYPRG